MTRLEMEFRRQAVAQAGREGRSAKYIARKFNLSGVAVYNICKALGVKLKRQSPGLAAMPKAERLAIATMGGYARAAKAREGGK